MISEQQQEQASLYVLGSLTTAERDAFEAELRANRELRQWVLGLERTADLLASAVPPVTPPPQLRDRILRRIDPSGQSVNAIPAALQQVIAGFRFVPAEDPSGWKPLPVPGASIKLLSVDRQRGYAVLLGRLAPGVRYPAHTHEGSEDLFLLTGDLHIGERRLGPGDFHHSDSGTSHPDNYSVEGCTLLAVLSVDHALAKFALA